MSVQVYDVTVTGPLSFVLGSATYTRLVTDCQQWLRRKNLIVPQNVPNIATAYICLLIPTYHIPSLQ